MNLFARRPEADAPAVAMPKSERMQDDPRYIEALQNDAKVSEAHTAIQARLREIELILRTNVEPTSTPATVADQVASALRFGIGGNLERASKNDRQNLSAEQTLLRKQEDAVRSQLGVQRMKAESTLSAEFANRARAEHIQIMRDHVAALRTLADVEARERAWFKRANTLGYSDVRVSVRAEWAHLGTLEDPNSAIANRVRSLSDFDRA